MELTKRKIVLLTSAAALIVLIALFAGPALELSGYLLSMPRQIELAEAPLESGRIHGGKCKWAIRLLSRLYVERGICGGSDTELRRRGSESLSMIGNLGTAWTDEISGLSESSGVSKESLALANCFLDLGLHAAGCRSIVMKGKDGGLLHAHNLDWDSVSGSGNLLLAVFRSQGGKDRLATVHIGFPGMIGALDVINEKGLALSFNQLGFGREAPESPVLLEMRDIASLCHGFDEARARILSMPRGMPFCIAVSDAKNGKAAVFERLADGEVKERGFENGLLAADNSPHCGKSLCGTCRTYDVAMSEKPEDAEALTRLMGNPQVMLASNIYSVVFDFDNDKMRIACQDMPAARGKFKILQLFGTR